MKLLDDPLIKKYFTLGFGLNPMAALAILEGMEAPIHNGDRYLYVGEDSVTHEMVWNDPATGLLLFRYNAIRLPEKFQRPDLEAELKEKIDRVAEDWVEAVVTVGGKVNLSHELRKLVDLARRAEREKIKRECSERKEPT